MLRSDEEGNSGTCNARGRSTRIQARSRGGKSAWNVGSFERCSSFASPVPSARVICRWPGRSFPGSCLAGIGNTKAPLGLNSSDTHFTRATNLQPVDDTSGPLSLAAFLNRSSHVELKLTDQSQHQQSFEGTELRSGPVTGEKSGREAAARYVWRESGWYVGGRAERAASQSRFEALGRESPRIDQQAVEVRFGKYIVASTTLELTWMSDMITSDPGEIVCESMYRCRVHIGSEVESDDVSLSARHVGRVAAFAYSLLALGGASETRSRPLFPSLAPSGGAVAPAPALAQALRESFRSDREREPNTHRFHALSGEINPTPTLGIGLGFYRTAPNSVDAPDSGQLHASVRWFVRRNVALDIGVSRTRRESALGQRARETDSVSVVILGRL